MLYIAGGQLSNHQESEALSMKAVILLTPNTLPNFAYQISAGHTNQQERLQESLQREVSSLFGLGHILGTGCMACQPVFVLVLDSFILVRLIDG